MTRKSIKFIILSLFALTCISSFANADTCAFHGTGNAGSTAGKNYGGHDFTANQYKAGAVKCNYGTTEPVTCPKGKVCGMSKSIIWVEICGRITGTLFCDCVDEGSAITDLVFSNTDLCADKVRKGIPEALAIADALEELQLSGALIVDSGATVTRQGYMTEDTLE